MKRWWDTQAARVDALSLRERVFLFLSVLAIGMAVADVVWLSPARLAHQQLTQRFDKQSVQLRDAREVLKLMAQPGDAGKNTRAEISTVQVRLDEVNQAIQAVLPTANQSTPLVQVLAQLLRRHEGLTLLRTATMAPAAAGAAPAGVTRQGVELTVSGSYGELTRYVQALEQTLPAVRWGSMKLKSEKQPPELTLQLYLVGVQP